MELISQKLVLRKQQISDMTSQLNDIRTETLKITKDLKELNLILSKLDSTFREKDEELKTQLEIKEKALNKLQELEYSIEGHKEIEEPEKKKDVSTANIEFYTKNVQSKPMFKKLPEFSESPEPSSPPTMNDDELDEELKMLGLSDVLKKYS
jgi:SMC interacting uncharacterized protein involved in chromosome segregation